MEEAPVPTGRPYRHRAGSSSTENPGGVESQGLEGHHRVLDMHTTGQSVQNEKRPF